MYIYVVMHPHNHPYNPSFTHVSPYTFVLSPLTHLSIMYYVAINPSYLLSFFMISLRLLLPKSNNLTDTPLLSCDSTSGCLWSSDSIFCFPSSHPFSHTVAQLLSLYFHLQSFHLRHCLFTSYHLVKSDFSFMHAFGCHLFLEPGIL